MDLSKVYVYLAQRRAPPCAKATIAHLLTHSGTSKMTPEAFVAHPAMPILARLGMVKFGPAAPGEQAPIVVTNYARRLAGIPVTKKAV
ncbi:hypothetical protein HYU90_02790 [Candidatus Collierbacteria bacterium]|nr:hypothetical protein [Candidatus Collierbacteria bacterium]